MHVLVDLFNFLVFGSLPLFGLPSEVRCNSLFQHDILKRQLSRFKFYCSNLKKNKTKQNFHHFVSHGLIEFSSLVGDLLLPLGIARFFSLIKPEFA